MELETGRPARTGVARPEDGQSLMWSECGPAEGRPVLLGAGAATSRLLAPGATSSTAWVSSWLAVGRTLATSVADMRRRSVDGRVTDQRFARA